MSRHVEITAIDHIMWIIVWITAVRYTNHIYSCYEFVGSHQMSVAQSLTWSRILETETSHVYDNLKRRKTIETFNERIKGNLITVEL